MIGLLVLYNSGTSDTLNFICNEIFKDKKLTYANSEIRIGKTLEDTTLDLKSRDFLIASDEQVDHLVVPTKGSIIGSWFNGFVSDKDKEHATEFLQSDASSFKSLKDSYFPAKLLLKLNSYKHEHSQDLEMNYTKLVHSRVTNYMQDSIFSLTLAYLTKGARSRVIIASKNKDVYFSLVYNNDYYALVWSDDVTTANKFKEQGSFIYGMTPMPSGGTFVIHPKFLMSKWKKWRTASGDVTKATNALRAVSILENYICRNTVKLECDQEATFVYK